MEYNHNKIIEECKKNFSRHQLTVICDHPKVKRFQFRQPDTGCYGFNLTTADNLIIMNGDTYSMLIEPGYGRQGLAFLRGSVKSVGYFLSKCPFRKELTEYSYDEALELLIGYAEDGYLSKEDIEDCYGLDDGELYGEHAYYELVSGKVDEPAAPRRLTHTTLNQIAGLQCFVEAYEKLCNQEEVANDC